MDAIHAAGSLLLVSFVLWLILCVQHGAIEKLQKGKLTLRNQIKLAPLALAGLVLYLALRRILGPQAWIGLLAFSIVAVAFEALWQRFRRISE
jgi:hypothetical protein